MAALMIRVAITCFLVSSQQILGRKMEKSDIRNYRQRVVEMFQHAYDGYIRYGYPYDELRPLTCDGHDTWGSYSLTLIDALDMLVVIGNNTEFQRVAKLVIDRMNFHVDINVSVFETNIRVVGGLLSAHLMSKRGGLDLDPGWPCTGPFLSLAENVARRILPAFDTPTGMPYGTVNLMHGVPKGETTVTCTAGVGTFVVEFGALSRLTGDPIFEKVAIRALRALWKAKSDVKLVGNHIDVATGKWTALDGGIGGGIDSYFEYLVKGSVMLNNPELLQMFNEYLPAIEKYLKRDDWYMWAHMTKGSISLPVFTSLDCYWPGIQTMLGDVDKAMKTIHNFHQVWKQFGFLPEYYNIVKNEAHAGREGYPLRPELAESAVYLYQATKDPYLLEIGADMLESIEQSTRTKCGYATVKDVNTHTLENRMESFFLAETVKYLYLLFDEDNFIHNTGDRGTVIDTPNGQCVIDTGGYIFNSEAHPIDIAALHCCSADKKEDDATLSDFHDSIDLLALLDITDRPGIGRKTKMFKEKNKPLFSTDMNDVDGISAGLGGSRIGEFSFSSSSSSQLNKDTIIASTSEALQKLEVVLTTDQVKVTDKKPEGVPIVPDHPTGGPSKGDSSCHGNNEDSSGSQACVTSSHEEKSKYQSKSKENSVDISPTVKTSATSNQQAGQSETRTDDIKLKSSVGNEETAVIDEEDEEEEDFDDTVESSENDPESVTLKEPYIVSTESTQTQQSEQSGGNVKDILNIFKLFTSELFSQGTSETNLKILHEKLKYYSLFQTAKPDLMMCKAQPFHMSMSVMGEMFVENP